MNIGQLDRLNPCRYYLLLAQDLGYCDSTKHRCVSLTSFVPIQCKS